jgi:hypothetical protein
VPFQMIVNLLGDDEFVQAGQQRFALAAKRRGVIDAPLAAKLG